MERQEDRENDREREREMGEANLYRRPSFAPGQCFWFNGEVSSELNASFTTLGEQPPETELSCALGDGLRAGGSSLPQPLKKKKKKKKKKRERE